MLDITKYVEDMLKDATLDELKNIIENGIDIPEEDYDDMSEALERAYVEVAEEKLREITGN